MKKAPIIDQNKEFQRSREDNVVSSKQRSLEALLEFVEQVNRIRSLKDAIWHLAHHTIKALEFEDCVIYLLDEDKKTLKQVAAYGPKNPQRYEILNPIKLNVGQGIVGKAALEEKTQLVLDTRLQQNYIIDDQKRFSELAVPIIFHGELHGVIDSEHSSANFFTEEHRGYVEILASVLASKISFEYKTESLKANILALEKSQKLSETYLAISELTYSSISIEDFYLHLHQVLAKQVNAQNFFVVLLDTENKQYTCPYIHDEQNGSQFNLDTSNKNLKNSLISEVIAKQRSRLVNYDELKIRQEKSLFILTKDNAQSWLAVPFEISQTLHGGIALQSYDPNVVFSEQDQEFLMFLGQHIATAIERKLKDQKLTHQALHDSVTGLANRSLFLDRLEQGFLRSHRKSPPDLAVLFIDFDDFKLINDNHGHQAGDKVLAITAQRMAEQLRAEDTLARIGGDEFAILLENMENRSFAIAIAQRVLKAMKPAIKVGTQLIYASISIGVGLKDETTESSEDLLNNADHAMYYAKEKGKNNIQLYEDSLHQAVIHAKRVVEELEIAIKEKQLLFYFQPIVNLNSGEVIGFEALMRWLHPKKGIVSPDEFIQIAEQNDLIRAIDSQLLVSVAKQLRHWNSISNSPVYISINISSQRFIDSQLIVEIEQVISRYNLRPGSIVVEVTEHILMENIGKARLLFHKLKSLGIKISLDDFGTGYSSLSYLHQLPFDIIKVDRTFITHIDENKPESPIINTIVALANTLKMEIVAEGIETVLQLDVLKSMQCQFGQGYYLAKPMPCEEAEVLVLNRNINHKNI